MNNPTLHGDTKLGGINTDTDYVYMLLTAPDSHILGMNPALKDSGDRISYSSSVIRRSSCLTTELTPWGRVPEKLTVT